MGKMEEECRTVSNGSGQWLSITICTLMLMILPLPFSAVRAAVPENVSAPFVCLLIHGFGGSTVEMEPLAKALESAGVEVVRLTLPGHETTLDDFSQTRFSDWSVAVEKAYQKEVGRGRNVIVVGHSMGGSLALQLAERHDLAGVVTLAAPVYLYRFFPPEAADWRLPLVGFLQYFRPRWPKSPDPPGAREIAPWGGYTDYRLLPQLHSFIQGLETVQQNLPEITEPMLIMQAIDDEVVPDGNALTIAHQVASADVTVELFALPDTPAGRHIIPSHRDCRERIAKRTIEFIQHLEKSINSDKINAK